MESVINIVLQAGRSAVDVVLYTLLPIMVLMMILVRVLEAKGVLDWITKGLAPLARPFGLSGLGVLAMIQISFVSFVAPLPTMRLMEDRGAPDRQLAATLAAVLAMAPANSAFPLGAMGLDLGLTLFLSAVGGLSAAAVTYWAFGRRLSLDTHGPAAAEEVSYRSLSLLKIINLAGNEAIRIVINIIPLLLLSLAVVVGLQTVGVVDGLKRLLAPALAIVGIHESFILPAITKYLAGSTALVGVLHETAEKSWLDPSILKYGAGFLLHPLDLPGVAILVSAGPRISKVCLPAICGGCIGIALRTAGTLLLN